ncbi:MAG: lipoprotein [Oscillospiraceae bacterium]
MKRLLSILMAMILCLTLCACGPESVTDAVSDAKAQLSEWSSQTYNNYKYSGVYFKEDNSFCIYMNYNGSNDSKIIAIDKMISKTASENVFKEINKMFSKFDTYVCVLMYYPDGDYIAYNANDYK